MAVGVLALQGDFEEHLKALAILGVPGRKVRRGEDLEGLTGLIFPGGESTVMRRLLAERGLQSGLLAKAREGLPLMGTCAGLILLSADVEGCPDLPLGLLDVSVRRNDYGRQVESFIGEVEQTGLEGGPLRGVFIRAPRITHVGKLVTVLATRGEDPVLVIQDRPGAPRCMGLSFHPELTDDLRIHRRFLEMTGGGADPESQCAGSGGSRSG